ncbi:MAG: nucleotidyltransferase [Gammaproteobacteria bacterium]|nr:MAG: nucleotidyltransferase [Gammaproteobacteria bacterium]
MLDFSSLNKAINSLTESIEVTENFLIKGGVQNSPQYRTFRSGVIQNFEFTYELAWKAIRTWIAENQGKSLVDGITRKELFRLAAENKLIENVKPWFEFHYFRNLTSHTYEEQTAIEVFQCITLFSSLVKQLASVLDSKND